MSRSGGQQMPKRGCSVLDQPIVSFEQSPTKGSIIKSNIEPHQYDMTFGSRAPGSISGYDKNNYHFLCGALGQRITVS